MKKKLREEIWKDGNSLINYPIDSDMNGKLESNGSVQHVVEFNGEYYYVQTSWQEEVGRVSKIDRKEELEEGGFVADAIKNFEESETK